MVFSKEKLPEISNRIFAVEFPRLSCRFISLQNNQSIAYLGFKFQDNSLDMLLHKIRQN